MQLTIRNLSKTYANGVKALQDVSLDIPTGMYGLLGPNGAGKSTLMRTLATLQDADAGTATLGEIDVLKEKDAVRRTLGYLPQEFGVYPRIKAVEMLDHLAVLKGIPSGRRKEVVSALLHRVNLWDHRKKSVASYSGGMRQRFGIAQALLGDPKLIIVDEPTAGLDLRMAVAMVRCNLSASSVPCGVMWAARLTEPRLQTATSLSLVCRVISVQRLELWTTPTCWLV